MRGIRHKRHHLHVLNWTMTLVPMPVVTEIMETLTDESSPSDLVGTMLCVPHPLLCRCLEALGPVLDFRGSQYSATDLSRFFSCLPSFAWRGICKLHLTFNIQNPNYSESSIELTDLPEGKFLERCKGFRHGCKVFDVSTHISIRSEYPRCQTLSAYFEHAPAVFITDVCSISMAVPKLCTYASNVTKLRKHNNVCCTDCGASTTVSAITHLMYGDIANSFKLAMQYSHPTISVFSGATALVAHSKDTCTHHILTFGGVAPFLYGPKHLGLHNIYVSGCHSTLGTCSCEHAPQYHHPDFECCAWGPHCDTEDDAV